MSSSAETGGTPERKVPLDSPTPDIPDVPDVPVPDVPDVPDVPAVPDVPDPPDPGAPRPGEFPAAGALMTVRRRAYVLRDEQDRTWLALEPDQHTGGVMSPLIGGAVVKVVEVGPDGVHIRASTPGQTDTQMEAYLVPRPIVPPSF